ncbi:DUF2620 family protein [Streptomonospora nanhaiensis]|uniref:DUF2620 domain-containing protein n=1 Tax=Streptomonospora nanhaiensis TaxID=1323731 RepID=A0A853BWI6_9ACTN|nr:DUF2620 family protein [Streptomonospora nanhaiensis]MBV2364536.1 DUF2620 domain-containing protein [Streptomonospora nanhaiensis]MBX9390278.1 DUF2620 domain-containing protein [Streptomonospora nanhaiensis]NYI99115.1 hypothetical protein [Streptomonospora nanhaiensis]
MKFIAGGVAKSEVADTLRPLLREGDTVQVGTDMDAAALLRTGAADYYLGTCHTGAGASLGVLVGLLGSDRTHTFGRRVPSAADVQAAVDAGKVAFGFALDQVQDVVPLLWAALDAKRQG